MKFPGRCLSFGIWDGSFHEQRSSWRIEGPFRGGGRVISQVEVVPRRALGRLQRYFESRSEIVRSIQRRNLETFQRETTPSPTAQTKLN